MYLSGTNSTLFFDVIGAFVQALPSPPDRSRNHDGHQMDKEDRIIRNNAITSLRFEVQDLSRVFTEERATFDLPNEDFGSAKDALEDILVLMDDLVDNGILAHNEQHASRSVRNPHLSKLCLLQAILQVHKQTIQIQSSERLSQEALKWVKYPARDALLVYYRKITKQAESFNNTMRRVYEGHLAKIESELAQFGTAQIYQPAYQTQSSVKDEERRAQEDIRDAAKVGETVHAITRVFTAISEPCNPPHLAYIRLSGFEQPEVEMLVSMCGGTTKLSRWHLVHWAKEIEQLPRIRDNKTFCSTLRDSRKIKTRLRISLKADGSWESIKSTERIQEAAAPKLTLDDCLTGKDSQVSSSALAQLTLKDILRLSLKISRSLLYLLGTPLSRNTWTTETIYMTQIAQELSELESRFEPYICANMSDFITEHDFEDSLGIKAALVHLALLLWELFFGRRVDVREEDMEEDEDSEDESDIVSKFNALNREQILSKHRFLQPQLVAIVGKCLDLYCQADSVDLAFRTDFYWGVVRPLSKYLEAYSFSGNNSGQDSDVGRGDRLQHFAARLDLKEASLTRLYPVMEHEESRQHDLTLNYLSTMKQSGSFSTDTRF